ncbi:FAD-dependent oxidoreductase [Propionibacteriaceae bacterium Y1700]|uniref:FAD-dependent oxidoreductase n=1 Tax=Microlunatus sp. Y1700 TaxID=3418487 RepID=UPI003DA6F649
MLRRTEDHDFVVCGGGLAGFAAAVAAARMGVRVALVQDRPVLGGNSSSEVRVVPRGSTTYHSYAREGGVLREAMAGERWRNHEPIFENGWTNSVWDLELYDIVQRTPGLTLHLNTTIREVDVADGRITAIRCEVAAAEVELEITGRIFLDATGDAIVADRAGCESRMGTEGRDEFDEPHATPEASDDTMGNSLHFKTKIIDRPVDYELPVWAQSYSDPDFFDKGGRFTRELRGGFWWIELGVPWHTIHDAEELRHELTRHTLGIWDWMKNKDPKTRDQLTHHALDWIGQVPGKRESRRIIGLHLMTEHDLLATEAQPDEIAYGGWNIDLHTPGGLLAESSEPTAAEGYVLTGDASAKAYVAPFGVPLRSLIARDVDNLLMAGRNVSATHVALGSVRVQATTAIMGQAAGTAAAVALLSDAPIAETASSLITTVQQRLLHDGCFLPNVLPDDPDDLARTGVASASSALSYDGAGTPAVGAVEDQRSLLAQRRGQWIPVSLGTEQVEVLLINRSETTVRVPVRISEVDHIWDYQVGTELLAEDELEVPPGEHWVRWPVAVPTRTPEQGGSVRYVRLDVGPAPEVAWPVADAVRHGAVSAFEMTAGRMRRFADGETMCHRVAPAQDAYPAGAVTVGADRPHRAPNTWIAAAADAEPWWEVRWPSAQQLEWVHLTFAGHVFREYDRTPPLFRDPGVVADYAIQVETAAGWQDVQSVVGNVQPRRVHRIDPVEATALRILPTRAGDAPIMISEVRCYGSAGLRGPEI